MSISNTYVITTSVSSDGTVPSALTIDTDGLITTKAELKIQPVSNILAFTVEPNLSANYEFAWPTTAPAANQVLAINSTGSIQNWFNLESPTTLVVRQNPAPGQFARPSQAVTFINTQSNYNTVYTIWIAPGYFDEGAVGTISELNFPMNVVGFGMNQSVVRNWRLNCNNNSASAPTINVSFSDMTFLFDFGQITMINLRNDYRLDFKNIGLFGGYAPFITVGDFPYKPSYSYSINVNRLWHNDQQYANFINFMIIQNTSVQNNVTSLVNIEDLRLNFLNNSVAASFFEITNGSGSKLTLKDSWLSAIPTAGSLGRVVSIGGMLLKNCVFTQNMSNTFIISPSVTFFNNNAQLVLSQVDTPSRMDCFTFSTTVNANTSYPLIFNDSDFASYQISTFSNQCSYLYPKFDRENADGLHQFTLYDDFTNPLSPYGDTIWQSNVIASGNITNVVTVANSANVFRNCDVVFEMPSANSALCLFKGTNASPMTHGSFLRFESAVQPQSNFAAGSAVSFVVGLGDDISAQTNVDLAFANSGIYFAFAPDFTPSANWYAYTRDSNSTYTRLDTNVVVNTNLTTLEFNFKRLTNSVIDFYVNENLVGSISSTIPISGSNVSLTPIIKSVYSTGAGNVAIDYVSYYARSNSMRRK